MWTTSTGKGEETKHMSDDFDRTSELGDDWTQTYKGDGQGLWARMHDMPSGIRWRNPTPAGKYEGAKATCLVCGNVVTVTELNETIRHGDPRLCEHMGGPSRVSNQ
jgi:hypothetical protein